MQSKCAYWTTRTSRSLTSHRSRLFWTEVQNTIFTTLLLDSTLLGNLRFSRRRCWRFKSSGILRRLDWEIFTDVSKNHISSVTQFTFRIAINLKCSQMPSEVPTVSLSSSIHTTASTPSASLRPLHNMQLISAIYFKLYLWMFHVTCPVHILTINTASNMCTLWYTTYEIYQCG